MPVVFDTGEARQKERKKKIKEDKNTEIGGKGEGEGNYMCRVVARQLSGAERGFVTKTTHTKQRWPRREARTMIIHIARHG